MFVQMDLKNAGESAVFSPETGVHSSRLTMS
jgi:hypothetical protein